MRKNVAEVRVHWGDTDRADMVYFANFYRFFEAGEVELYRSAGKSRRELMERLNVRFPRIESHCEYHSPARYDDLLEIHTQVDTITDKTYTLVFKVYRKGETDLIAEGYIICCCITVVGGELKPTSIPDEIVKILKGE